LSEIVENICNGDNSTISYFSVAEKYLSISKADYNTRWRAKVEHLARQAREQLKL